MGQDKRNKKTASCKNFLDNRTKQIGVKNNLDKKPFLSVVFWESDDQPGAIQRKKTYLDHYVFHDQRVGLDQYNKNNLNRMWDHNIIIPKQTNH